MSQRIVIPGFRKIETSGGGEGGTTNYEKLSNKPSINNVPLVGNLKTVDLKLTDSTLTEEGVPADAKTVGNKLEEQSTSLTALSEQLGSHTVKSDVPVDAVFTDTIYDDTEVKESIEKLNSNLDGLGYGEVAGGKNLWDEQWQVGIISADDGSYINYNGDICSINFIKVKPNTTYYVASNVGVYIKYFDSSKNPIGDTWGSGSKNSTFKTTSDTAYIKFRTNKNGGTYNDDIAIIEGKGGDYQPYIPSVKMLAEEKADKSETTVNLLNPTLQTTALNGITCTNNGDGTYTLNGTASSATYLTVGSCTLKDNEYKLLGCPSTGGYEKYVLYLSDTMQSDTTDTGNGVILQKEATSYPIKIGIWPGITLNNVIFKPMITTNLDATYDDFVPYTGDTGQLNKDVASLLKRIETLESLVNKTDTTVAE